MWSNDRRNYRDYFYNVWQKQAQFGVVLTPLEMQIAEVIQLHPEYHFIFTDERSKERDYFLELGETNPFLHLALHLSLREQLATNRPAGIRAIYDRLVKLHDPHQAEHLMMDHLQDMIFKAMRGEKLDDINYIMAFSKIK